MKKNKKFNPSWIFGPLIILLIIVAIIFFIVGLNKGWFGIGQQFGKLDLIELFGGEPDVECTFVVDNSTVCLWDNVTGTINANSPDCYVGYNYNNEGWRFAGIIHEISPEFYKESRQATVLGHYEFVAICGIPTDFCRTNNVEVDVIPCDEEGEDCDYTCGWVGEQCGGTCPPTHPLCVDMWYESLIYPDYIFCACIDPNTEEVHSDWKPDGPCHDDSGSGEVVCTDTDPLQDVHLFGTCTSTSGIPEPDVCSTDTSVTQMWCSDDGTFCWGASYPCPNGEICIGGVCVEGYEYKPNIDPSEAIPGLTYGEEDMDGCISGDTCLQMCQLFVDSEVDSAHCEGTTERMIPCSEGWNNCGGGEGEGDWYCCNFKVCDSYQQGSCCGDIPDCDCVCERWYISGS